MDRTALWLSVGVFVIIFGAVIWKLNYKPNVPNIPQNPNNQEVQTYPTNTLPAGGKG